jgi:hypothetical protein
MTLNLIWPRHTQQQATVFVRIGRLIHWSAIGFAIFGLVVSLYGMLQVPGGEPLAYFAVIFMWCTVAMVGRGVRYVLARE